MLKLIFYDSYDLDESLKYEAVAYFRRLKECEDLIFFRA
jgi:hypothetical protein